jgi:hypothetical protein
VAEGRAVVDQQHRRPGGRVLAPAPAQQLARLGDHVLGVVGLADVLVRAGAQAADARGDLGLAREHQDDRRAPRLARAQLLEQLDAVAVGQQHVEHGDRDVPVRECAPRLGRGGARARAEAGGLEGLAQVHAHRQAVVDDHDGARHRTVSAGSASALSAGPISASGRMREAAPSTAASRGMP